MSFPKGDVVVGVGPERALRGRPVMGHDLAATGSGRLEDQATEARPDRRRRHNRVDKPRPVHPKRSKAIHESHGVAATTPILPASPGPATTNTYMRFSSPARSSGNHDQLNGKSLRKTPGRSGRRSAEVVARLRQIQPAKRVPAGLGGPARRRLSDQQEEGSTSLARGRIAGEGPQNP